MNLRRLRNSRGVTLAELIVAMALTSMLLGLVVTGSLFLKRYINQWQERDRLMEELVFIEEELSRTMSKSQRINMHADSLVCLDSRSKMIVYRWHEGKLMKNGRQLSQSNLILGGIAISKMDLPLLSEDTILYRRGLIEPSGLYKLVAVVSDNQGNTDSLVTLVRNDYEYFKYTPF